MNIGKKSFISTLLLIYTSRSIIALDNNNSLEEFPSSQLLTPPALSIEDSVIIKKTKKVLVYSQVKNNKLSKSGNLVMITHHDPEYAYTEYLYHATAEFICPYESCSKKIKFSSKQAPEHQFTETIVHYGLLRNYCAHLLKHESKQINTKYAFEEFLNNPNPICLIEECRMALHSKSAAKNHLFCHICWKYDPQKP